MSVFAPHFLCPLRVFLNAFLNFLVFYLCAAIVFLIGHDCCQNGEEQQGDKGDKNKGETRRHLPARNRKIKVDDLSIKRKEIKREESSCVHPGRSGERRMSANVVIKY